MQSFWFAGLAFLVLYGFAESAPVTGDQFDNKNESVTRLIVPPEMTPNYFEILKNKSEKDSNSTKADNVESTPMNFLRSGDDSFVKMNSVSQKPLLGFDGYKQTPIFITIPIYISSGSQGLPIIAASIEQITPSKLSSKNSAESILKTKENNQLISILSPNAVNKISKTE